MARASRKTPQRIAAVREDLAAGMSLRAIARKRSIPTTTLQRWIGDLPETKASKRADRETAAAPEQAGLAESQVAPAPASAQEAEALLAAPRPEGLEDHRERLGLLRGLLLRLEPAVEAETFSATSYVALSKYADELSVRIIELTPPAPKDPNEDPDVIEAGDVLVARVRALIEAAEERSRACPTCGVRRTP